MPRAYNPFWDSKYVRCITNSDFYDKEFVSMLKAWEEGYMAENGGDAWMRPDVGRNSPLELRLSFNNGQHVICIIFIGFYREWL